MLYNGNVSTWSWVKILCFNGPISSKVGKSTKATFKDISLQITNEAIGAALFYQGAQLQIVIVMHYVRKMESTKF